MPSYNKQVISKQAQELGFIRDTFEKMLRLAEMLRFMSNDPLLSSSLALKGGTAINLTIFNLPRLSVDIDLDYVHNNSRDDMLKERGLITAVVSRYLASEGYELGGKSKTTHSLDSFVCNYTNSGGVKDAIKIEVNYSLRCHVLLTVSRRIETLGVFSETNIMAVAPIEIFASKITALLSRTAARDLYDINNMVLFGLFSEADLPILRKCALFYFTISGDEVPEDINVGRIYGLTNHMIRIDLQPVLRKKERFNLQAAQKRVDEYLTGLFAITESEREYLNSFRKGVYNPGLLFEDTDIHERIRNHPMALWKTRNNEKR